MNDLPKRKSIRLKDYDYSQNGVYFVTICTEDKQKLLGCVVGDDAHIVPHVQLSGYGSIVAKYIENINRTYANISVDKCVIMPNHIHMIIIIGNRQVNHNGTMWASSPTGLASIVRSLKTLVSKEYGCSFWQRGYYDHIIRDEAGYLKIWQYIDTNPAKWAEDKYYTEE